MAIIYLKATLFIFYYFFMSNQIEYKRDQEGSKIAKIVVDRDLCIGAQSCIAPAGATYVMDGENKVIVSDANAATDADLIASAQACPTKAISLYDKDGQPVT